MRAELKAGEYASTRVRVRDRDNFCENRKEFKESNLAPSAAKRETESNVECSLNKHHAFNVTE